MMETVAICTTMTTDGPQRHRQIDSEHIGDEDEDQHTAIAVEFKDRSESREPE